MIYWSDYYEPPTDLTIRVKRHHPNAVIPKYMINGDACFDLTGVTVRTTDKFIEFDCQISFEIPHGYVGLVFPRSSITKKNLILKNSVGVIDSGYRDTIKVRFDWPNKAEIEPYSVGERIAQMMIIPHPQIRFIETDDLSVTDRTGGFGTTGV